MNLETIFNQLRTGELSQMFLSEVDPTTGEFTEEKKLQLIRHVSLGLTALHRRFNIKEGQITLELVPGQQRYVLDKAYAESNSRSQEPVKYIKDSVLPFTNDLLKIKQVFDESGKELPLNVAGDPQSIVTPLYNLLVVPEGLSTKTLRITYRAGHKPLEGELLYYPPAYVPIDLPDVYLEPLLYFIASRVHNPTGMDNTFHQGSYWASLYEKTCQELAGQNYELEVSYKNNKFERNGWV